jgi:hypothetical protein
VRKRPNHPSPNAANGDNGLGGFARKSLVFSAIFSAIFAVGLNLSLNQALPDVYSVERLLLIAGERINTELQNDRSRLRLAGFLSRNPYVHYRISVLEENAGRLDRAIEEIELALGLFELSPANNPARGKYQQRLNELNNKRTALPRKN